MPRVSVKAAIQSYIAAAGIEDLGTIYTYAPKLTPEGNFFDWTDPAHSSGAVIYMHLLEQADARVEPRGPDPADQGGLGKMTRYQLLMPVYFRSSEQETEDVAELADQFLDDLCAVIRADRTAGTGPITPVAGAPAGDGSGTIWQWGEGSFLGGEDIVVTAEFPRLLGDAFKTSQVLAHVRVSVVEMLGT